jgi:hypothetical protein
MERKVTRRLTVAQERFTQGLLERFQMIVARRLQGVLPCVLELR